ncbi:MAG: tRNA pseudouridine(38-40) synthase TruA [Desulfatitalea sp.]|nr:tRNA pseudouridine(38-40) synthase TruA [Desulfatitalea sp.]MBI5896294.1 tRNA pseudouridine(38-40) synthase TruA [Desulfobacterales bacterium]
MRRNFKLIIEYDGTDWHGWQRQPNGRTIQEEIESALATMSRQAVTLIGSGRTDAGVHALGQVANFTCETAIAPLAFQKGLNSLLPPDIVIRECSEVPLAFHARYDVRAKIYRYTIRNSPLPAAIGRHYAWWIRAPLDVAAMVAAAGHLVGEKDFKAFEGTGSPRAHSVRHVTRTEVRRADEAHIHFEIEANGFLRYMVRNLTGTLVAVGMGHLPPDDILSVLNSRDRRLAAPTAPAQGLCLVRVIY